MKLINNNTHCIRVCKREHVEFNVVCFLFKTCLSSLRLSLSAFVEAQKGVPGFHHIADYIFWSFGIKWAHSMLF